MLFDSVAHFTKAAPVTRQLVPMSVVSHSFGGIDIRMPPNTYFV